MYSKTGNNYKGAGRRVISLVLAIALICSFGLTSVFAETIDTIDSGLTDSGVGTITVSPEKLTLKIDEKKELTATITVRDSGSDKTVEWKSRDTDVAMVNATTGVVTAVSEGETEIKVTAAGGKSATAAITVTANLKTLTAPTDQTLRSAISTELEAIMQLPKTVAVTTTGSTTSLALEWEGVNASYNNGSEVINPFKWSATLPATITNTNNVVITGTVQVKNAKSKPLPTIDTTKLTVAIADAKAAKKDVAIDTDAANVTTGTKWVTQAVSNTFETAITAATDVLENANKTDETVNEAVATLGTATTTYNKAKQDGTKPAPAVPKLEVTVRYPNTNGYVSIDTKDKAKASDYFGVNVWSEGYGWEVTNVALAPNQVLNGLLTVSTADIEDVVENYDYKQIRFVPIAGKTLVDGVYNVAMTGVAKGDGTYNTFADVPFKFNVELHISATDPAYFTVGKAIFNVADLNNPAKELISEPITIKVPSGNEISTVKLAEKDTPYSVQDGKWDSAKKEYSFKLKAVADKDGKYNFNYETSILATFKNSKARMAFVPAEVDIAVRTTDAKLAEYVKVEPNRPLIVGNDTSIDIDRTDKKLPEGANIYGQVKKITNFISTPADALSNSGYSWIEAEKAGSATFDAETTLTADGCFKVSANSILWLAKGNKIATAGTATGEARVGIASLSKIDINDLNTYKVNMEVYARDKDGKAEEIKEIKFLTDNNHNNFFKAPTTLVNDKNIKYTFTLELKNEKKEFEGGDFSLLFEVTTTSGTKKVSAYIDAVAGAPKSIYFTKDGKKITNDTLSVGADGTKYGVVVEGYKMLPNNSLFISGGDKLTIVRGNNFYNDMGTNEQITVRLNKTLPKDGITWLSSSLYYTPEITNKEVKLTLVKGSTISFSGESINIYSKEVAPDPEKPTPPTPTPPSGGGSSSGGSSSSGGTSTPSVDAPSSNVGSTGEVKSEDIKAETSKAVADAVKATPGATANVTVKNADNITPAALKEMAAAATKAGGKVQLMADSVVNGVIETRLYINPALAATLTAPIKLGVTTNSLEIDATKARFASFANNIAVASFAQQGSFGMKIQVAVKLDLTTLNTKTLVFYSYDKATNKYIPIVAPAYTIDKNGYLHFSTTVGGDIIITDKALVKK